MHAPVLVLRDSLKRESGRKVHHANIQAAKAVADIIRTTLGPRSMLKMLLDASGGIVVTNDGNAILRELDLAHPAAKSMIELSRTQDEEVGDGTTSVIVLGGEMLHVAEAFIEKNYHPTVICRAYSKALEDAIAVIDKIAMSIDVNDRPTMLGLVKSCIGTKFTSQFGDLIADLAIDATSIVGVDLGQGMREVDIKKYIKVEKVPGGQLEDSKVLKGVMFNKDVVAPGKMKRKIVNPRIILLDCPVEYKKGENQTNAELVREEDWEVLLKMEEEYIENMCAQILKLPSSLNANLSQPSLSCGAKLYSGLKLQFPSLYATGRPNLTAEFYGKVNKSLQCGTRNHKPTRAAVKMMPIGTPRVPYRTPGEGTWQWVDIWNALYRERILFIGQNIDEEFSNQILATMLYLDTIDDSKRMYLYINGPGGDLTPSLAIYDTMQSLKSPVGTHCVGFAYNLAGFLLTAGEKGNRSAMPLSRIALQSPAGAARGQADDICNEANELLRIRDYLYNELSKKTGQPFEKISKDLSRMKRFEAQDALEYGLIDRIIRPPRIDDDVGPSDASAGLG